MKATNEQLTRIINGNRQFIIPVFQRDYSWTKEQCKQMLGDVLRANKSGHFMGSIVYAEDDSRSAFQSWLVIDGQQRLTTLTLLFVALRDHINAIDSPSFRSGIRSSSFGGVDYWRGGIR